MKLFWRAALLTLLLILLLPCLFACADGTGEGGGFDGSTVYYREHYEDKEADHSVKLKDDKLQWKKAPTRESYVLIGLYNAKGERVFDENGDLVGTLEDGDKLTCYWVPKKCTVYYCTVNVQGDVLATKTEQLDYGAAIESLPQPTEPEGYHNFKGWCRTKGIYWGDNIVSDGTVPGTDYKALTADAYPFAVTRGNEAASYERGEVYLYAMLGLKRYTLTLDYNDGSGRTAEKEIEHGDSVTDLTLPTEETATHELLYWSTSPDAYVAPDTFTGDLTLYATWVAYRDVTLYLAKGKEGALPVVTLTESKRVYEGQTLHLTHEAQAGYTLAAWYTDLSLSDSSRVSTGHQPFADLQSAYYQHLVATVYTVTFQTAAGESACAPLTYTIEDSLTLPVSQKTHYSLLGWKQNGQSSYTSTLPVGTTGNLTLLPVWQGVLCTMTYTPPSGIPQIYRVRYGEYYTLEAIAPSADDLLFDGWFDLSGNRLTGRDAASLGIYNFHEEAVTITAGFVPIYLISVTGATPQTGTVTCPTARLEQNDPFTVTATPQYGYRFVGFFDENDTLVSANATYTANMPARDLQLKAVFEPVSVTVTLQSGEGYTDRLDGAPTHTLTFGESFTLPIAYKQGYVFGGWAYDGKALTSNRGEGLTPWCYAEGMTLSPVFVALDPPPILILTLNDLLAMREDPTGNYLLGTDLDVSAIGWQPFAFDGTLDGDGHTLSGFNLGATEGDLGVFTAVTGTIQNITFDVKITHYLTHPIAPVSVGGITAVLSGTLSHVTVTGEVLADLSYVGGLVGSMTGGVIEYAENRAKVTSSSYEAAAATGGLVGYAAKGSKIIKSINRGEIMGSMQVGGIVGRSESDDLSNLTNHAQLRSSEQGGGIVGHLFIQHYAPANLYQLTNNGTVASRKYAGGIIGQCTVYVSDKVVTARLSHLTNNGEVIGEEYVGGIIGYLHANAAKEYHTSYGITAQMSDLINTANVTGETYVGGIIGYAYTLNTGSRLIRSASSGTVTAQALVGGLAGHLENISLVSCSNENTVLNATGFVLVDGFKRAFVGGYVGRGYTVSDCHNKVDITYTGDGSFVGGIAGYLTSGVDSCTNDGEIVAASSVFVGGIVGGVFGEWGASFTDLTNHGDVTGNESVGGIIGGIESGADRTGDHVYEFVFDDILNDADVSGTNFTGGMMGKMVIDFKRNGPWNPQVALTMTDIQVSGDVTVTGSTAVGYLIGYAEAKCQGTCNAALVTYQATGRLNGAFPTAEQLVGYTDGFTVQ
ncbi:MAG: hypothetical protein E7639_04780 [Ruminococcaceae bacterium]|nr:hypothetical protein [Oscillospiraceae bacterium]